MPWSGKPREWEWGREEVLDSDDILAGAQIAADLGMHGMTNCGQWFRPFLPRFCQEKLVWAWPGDVGNFTPLPNEYPDFRAFVHKLQSLGIMCMPWISPWVAGRHTAVSRRLREALVDVAMMDHSDPRYDAATSYLCPRMSAPV